MEILLADDGRLERACLGRRLEPELLVEPHAEGAVAAERFVRTPERVESQHLGAVCALAEAVERRRRLGVGKGGCEVELGQRRVGRVEVSAQNPALIAATQVQRPDGVRLVLEHLAAYERERLLERGPGEAGGFAGRALEQLVEAVEVERNQLGRESVRLRFGDDQLSRPLPVRAEVASQHRDEGLERSGRVLRPLVGPDELGETIGGHEVATSRQEDLEHLLRSHPAEVAWPECALSVLDRELSEQTDHGLPRGIGAHRTTLPFGRTTSQSPPNSHRARGEPEGGGGECGDDYQRAHDCVVARGGNSLQSID